VDVRKRGQRDFLRRLTTSTQLPAAARRLTSKVFMMEE
jgi:hypothetical protein